MFEWPLLLPCRVRISTRSLDAIDLQRQVTVGTPQITAEQDVRVALVTAPLVLQTRSEMELAVLLSATRTAHLANAVRLQDIVEQQKIIVRTPAASLDLENAILIIHPLEPARSTILDHY